MIPSALFDQQKGYTIEELSQVFDCSAETIERWMKEGTLVEFTTTAGHEFLGYDVIRAVERSEELQQKLADARTIEETAADSRYLENLEERVRELEAENKRLRERIGGRQNVALDEVEALLRELHQKVDRLAPGETRASGRGV